jgi:hypothetical protein
MTDALTLRTSSASPSTLHNHKQVAFVGSMWPQLPRQIRIHTCKLQDFLHAKIASIYLSTNDIHASNSGFVAKKKKKKKKKRKTQISTQEIISRTINNSLDRVLLAVQQSGGAPPVILISIFLIIKEIFEFIVF